MTRNHDPFTKALTSLRDRARTGVYPPGQPIVILEEARRLNLSTTPVREALAALSGEGLVERGVPGGFLSPALDAGGVRDRYSFRLTCLFAALDQMARLQDPLPWHPGAAGSAVAVPTVLAALVGGAGSPALTGAYALVDSHLARLGSAERALFQDQEAEATALFAALGRREDGPRRAALDAYHRRRMEAASQLVLTVESQAAERPT